jgi:hypothetical protein
MRLHHRSRVDNREIDENLPLVKAGFAMARFCHAEFSEETKQLLKAEHAQR